MYVRKYFKDEAKRNALDMVEDIRAEFMDILRNLEWMDDSTRYLHIFYWFILEKNTGDLSCIAE